MTNIKSNRLESLITTARHRVSEAPNPDESYIRATQSDRGRLIYSAPFRRLQLKAQVFSMERNAAVRSRLTHSLEVAHVGRYIVSSILVKIAEIKDKANPLYSEREFWQKESLSISNIVETACLMHDIGNPPFGHFGEAAIKDWFKSSKLDNSIKQSFKNFALDLDCNSCLHQLKKDINIMDFAEFDGNPQGFRIVTKLQGDDGKTGLNLTHSQLAAFLKYSVSPSNICKDKPFSKKAGFFSSEQSTIEETWNKLKMPPNKRHPLGFLMEAADDISYCLSDIEDGFEKRIITESEFIDEVKDKLDGLIKKTSRKSESSNIQYPITNKLLSKLDGEYKENQFLGFKTTLTNELVDFVATEFVDKYGDFIKFKVTVNLIDKETEAYEILNILKEFTGEKLFASQEAESIELTGYAVISGILDDYSRLLVMTNDEFKELVNNNKHSKYPIETRLYHRLPKRCIRAYKEAVENTGPNNKLEWNLRAHLVVDYIAGMTDNFALETYQLLKGINIG